MNRKRGFTLIEALTVVSIIGILATLTTYVASQAQRQARDAKRKADLTAIALAFQARYDSETCNNQADLHYYPGRSLVSGDGDISGGSHWVKVSELSSVTDGCGAFSEYLTFIPNDPNNQVNFPYIFDLSKEPPGTDIIIGKHYRLGARLEKQLSLQESDELARMSRVWQLTFGGKPYPLTEPGRYSYFIGN